MKDTRKWRAEAQDPSYATKTAVNHGTSAKFAQNIAAHVNVPSFLTMLSYH